MRPGGPDWSKVDKTVERVKEREQNKPKLVETARTEEAGVRQMTDEEYAQALDDARAEIRKANPKLSEAEVETQATARADEARRHPISYRSASSTYELQRP